jgi:hypothetical protein
MLLTAKAKPEDAEQAETTENFLNRIRLLRIERVVWLEAEFSTRRRGVAEEDAEFEMLFKGKRQNRRTKSKRREGRTS